jgi:hypothetical protein
LSSLFGQVSPCATQLDISTEQEKYVSGVTQAEEDRENRLLAYSSEEYYSVYRRNNPDTAATRVVNVDYVKGRGKQFTEVKREGSGLIQSRLLDKVVNEQLELSKPTNRVKALITAGNYQMRLACKQKYKERECARLELVPRRSEQWLINGYVLVDANSFHLVWVEGVLAKKPTFWALRPQLVREYFDNKDGVFLASNVKSSAGSLLLGNTQVNIQYEYRDVHWSA